MSRPRRFAAACLPALAVAWVAVVPVPLAAASADTLPTRVSLLVGIPEKGEAAGDQGVLVVPGTVIPLSAGAESALPGSIAREEAHGERLAAVARDLVRTLRLADIQVRYSTAEALAVGQAEDLPGPSAASGLGIRIELLGASPDRASYRVVFREGGRVIADSKVSVERGRRAVVGGLDGDEAPYLFLVLEPASITEGALPVGGDVTPPRVLFKPAPRYTPEAKASRVQGIVILQAVIDEQGVVRDVRVLKGLPLGLTEAAAEAVRQWTFEPARDARGQPVRVYYNLTINFTLGPDEGGGGSSVLGTAPPPKT